MKEPLLERHLDHATLQIGLHRDSSRWKLDYKTVNWRRRTFWEMNISDKWKVRVMFTSPELYL